MEERLSKGILDMDLDHGHWSRFFNIDGTLSMVLVPLAVLDGEERAEVCLCAAEKRRLDEFAYAKRRQEWLGGRMAAKAVFLSVVDRSRSTESESWSSLEVAAGESGRPYIRDAVSLQAATVDVSISHSHDWAAAMATANGRCGVDIQKITPQVLKIKERFVDANEHGILTQACDRHQESSRLILLWAAKEALKKAIGARDLPGFLGLKLKRAAQQEGGPAGTFVELTFSLVDRDVVRGGVDEFIVAAFCYNPEYVVAFTVQEDFQGDKIL